MRALHIVQVGKAACCTNYSERPSRKLLHDTFAIMLFYWGFCKDETPEMKRLSFVQQEPQ